MKFFSFFFSLTGENTFVKVKQLWNSQTLMPFVYLASAWVIFVRLKFFKKGIWRETFLSFNICKFWDTWGGKGIIQQRKQQKAMRQICDSVNKLRHFQTAVCWAVLVFRRWLNVCRSILKFTSFIPSLECFQLHVWW